MRRVRYFKTKDGWLVDTTGAEDEFSVTAEQQATDIGEAYGKHLTVVELDADAPDPRDVMLPAYEAPPAPPTARAVKIAAITAAKDVNELKAALLTWLN